jgi:hypothetical protein
MIPSAFVRDVCGDSDYLRLRVFAETFLRKAAPGIAKVRVTSMNGHLYELALFRMSNLRLRLARKGRQNAVNFNQWISLRDAIL